MNNKGYTVIELMAVIAVILSLAVTGGLVYAAFHFISKFW